MEIDGHATLAGRRGKVGDGSNRESKLEKRKSRRLRLEGLAIGIQDDASTLFELD